MNNWSACYGVGLLMNLLMEEKAEEPKKYVIFTSINYKAMTYYHRKVMSFNMKEINWEDLATVQDTSNEDGGLDNCTYLFVYIDWPKRGLAGLAEYITVFRQMFSWAIEREIVWCIPPSDREDEKYYQISVEDGRENGIQDLRYTSIDPDVLLDGKMVIDFKTSLYINGRFIATNCNFNVRDHLFDKTICTAGKIQKKKLHSFLHKLANGDENLPAGPIKVPREFVFQELRFYVYDKRITAIVEKITHDLIPVDPNIVTCYIVESGVDYVNIENWRKLRIPAVEIPEVFLNNFDKDGAELRHKTTVCFCEDQTYIDEIAVEISDIVSQVAYNAKNFSARLQLSPIDKYRMVNQVYEYFSSVERYVVINTHDEAYIINVESVEVCSPQ